MAALRAVTALALLLVGKLERYPLAGDEADWRRISEERQQVTRRTPDRIFFGWPDLST